MSDNRTNLFHGVQRLGTNNIFVKDSGCKSTARTETGREYMANNINSQQNTWYL